MYIGHLQRLLPITKTKKNATPLFSATLFTKNLIFIFRYNYIEGVAQLHKTNMLLHPSWRFIREINHMNGAL